MVSSNIVIFCQNASGTDVFGTSLTFTVSAASIQSFLSHRNTCVAGTSNFTPAALLQGDDKSEEEAMAFAVQVCPAGARMTNMPPAAFKAPHVSCQLLWHDFCCSTTSVL